MELGSTYHGLNGKVEMKLIAAVLSGSRIPSFICVLALSFSILFTCLPAESLSGEFYVKDKQGVQTYTNITPRKRGEYKHFMIWGNGKKTARLKAFTYSSVYDSYIKESADGNNIDPNLVKAIIKVESNFNRTAVSKKGAMGVMQLMPETARINGVSDPFNPEDNIMGGSKYLHRLMEMFDYNIELVLAAYNAGENAVIKYGYKIPPFAETRDYVRRVMHHYEYITKSSKYRI